jgi:hypothetical protein
MRSARDLLLVAVLLLPALPSLAQTDPHHPAGEASPPAASPPSHAPAGATPMPSATTPGGAMTGSRMTGGGMMTMPGMMGEGAMPMVGMMAMMAAHPEGWIAFLKTELKITEAQSAAWNGFAEALRASRNGMIDMQAGTTGPQAERPSLPDRLGLQEKRIAAELEAMRRIGSALAPLYASLSDEQKRTADELMMPMTMM